MWVRTLASLFGVTNENLAYGGGSGRFSSELHFQ